MDMENFIKISRHYKALELDKILNMLAGETDCDDAKKIICDIIPSSDEMYVRSLLQQTDDAFVTSVKFGVPSFSGLKNIDEPLQKAEFGGSLSTKELLKVVGVLKVFRGIKVYQERVSEMPKSLIGKFSEVHPNNHLLTSISKAIISEDEIADEASTELYRIRKKIQSLSLRIREQLGKMIHSVRMQKYLQDPVVTIREGRFVIPVKSEYKGEVPGLIHDTSASGATLFVEPMSIVDANNNIRVLQSEERNEINKILLCLSNMVGEFASAIRKSYEMAVNLCVIYAKADLAYKMHATLPKINTLGKIKLHNARHPLIKKDEVVPIDVELGIDFDTLVVTGPNTGGKTVALKTVGLLTLMTMCGLLIPVAEGSEISIFDQVLVDVGDEQSIEQSLSTFSSHMLNIIDILKLSAEEKLSQKLILIDELGSGTDPVEGAALAIAILEKFHTCGAKVFATTHYAQLKAYALRTDKVQNASCEFDIKTLRPTYKLLIGIPGKSNAFAITEKLGIDKSILDRAQEFVSTENAKFEEVIASLEESRQALESEKENIDRTNAEIVQLKDKLAKEYADLKKQKEYLQTQAKEKAFEIVRKTKLEATSILDELKKIKADSKALQSEDRAKLKKKLAKMEDAADPVEQVKYTDGGLSHKVKKGDALFVIDLNKSAVAISDEDSTQNVMVQVGGMKLRVPVKNLRFEKKKQKQSQAVNKRTVQSKVQKKIVQELDLRGYDSIDAIIELDKFIDSALLSGVNQLTIIHGKGTGVLRSAVQNHLKSHKSVKNYRLGNFGEGEAGVTIVTL